MQAIRLAVIFLIVALSGLVFAQAGASETQCNPTSINDNCEIPQDWTEPSPEETAGTIRITNPCYDDNPASACNGDWPSEPPVVYRDPCEDETATTYCSPADEDAGTPSTNPGNPEGVWPDDPEALGPVQTVQNPCSDDSYNNAFISCTPEWRDLPEEVLAYPCEDPGKWCLAEVSTDTTPEEEAQNNEETEDTSNEETEDTTSEESDTDVSNEDIDTETDNENTESDSDDSSSNDTYQSACGGKNIGNDAQNIFATIGSGAGTFEDIVGDFGWDVDLGFFTDITKEGGDIAKDASSIIGLGDDILCLFEDFSVSKLAKLACSGSLYADADADATDTACKVSGTIDKLEKTITESRGSFLSTADGVFTDLVSDGWFDAENADEEAFGNVSTALGEFETEMKKGSDASLKTIYEKGKLAIAAAKTLALNNSRGDDVGGAAFTLAKDYDTETKFRLQENAFESQITQRGIQQLSDAGLAFTGMTEELNQEFGELSIQRQGEGTVAVSTRAATKVVQDSNADLIRLMSNTQLQGFRLETTQLEAQVMTANQISLMVEEQYRQAKADIEQREARRFEEMRLTDEEVDKLVGLYGDASFIFEEASLIGSD